MSKLSIELTPSQRGQFAEKLVKNYLESEGWIVTPRKDVNEKRTGYDYKATKDNNTRYIEVKGTSKPFSVPDMHENEFDLEKKKLKATHLYIVSNITIGKNPVLNIISAKLINRKIRDGTIKFVTSIRIKGRYFNKIDEFADRIELDLRKYNKHKI